MAEHKPLYRHSYNEAVRLNETDQWRESWYENVACREFISENIDLNYDGMRLGGDVADEAIAEFGYDRVNFVLANTIRLKDHDSRFSAENREWAKGFFFEPDDIYRHDFSIDEAHPGLLNHVVNQAREAYEQLNLFGKAQCIAIRDFETVAGQVLVVNPDFLTDEFKAPDAQLFKASHGNGCRPTAIGQSIFGEFLIDGEKARYLRHEFLGVLKPELLPEWAMDKLVEPEQEPEEFEDAAMGEGAVMQFHGF